MRKKVSKYRAILLHFTHLEEAAAANNRWVRCGGTYDKFSKQCKYLETHKRHNWTNVGTTSINPIIDLRKKTYLRDSFTNVVRYPSHTQARGFFGVLLDICRKDHRKIADMAWTYLPEHEKRGPWRTFWEFQFWWDFSRRMRERISNRSKK